MTHDPSDDDLETIARGLYAAAWTWRAIAGVLGGAFIAMTVFSFMHLRDVERLTSRNLELIAAARERGAECYTSLGSGTLELESADPGQIERGRGRLVTMLDLCFPADGNAPRPSAWLMQIHERSTPDQILRVTAALRDGWNASTVGRPWRGALP
jgi:hypothetical protein